MNLDDEIDHLRPIIKIIIVLVTLIICMIIFDQVVNILDKVI
ncbi:MAG: hypothetical protein BAJALOKI1v1_2480006 [Promethearchaeota archaeon]|nr:MAG: hypothetical protein BAJALOKI1v1_2480006 [Candidatus Lokiarchaeota archaeon]